MTASKQYKTPFPIVLIYATDWSHNSGLQELDDDFSTEPAFVVGFLVKETKQDIAIALEYFTGLKEVRDTSVIPKSTILFRKTIVKKGAVLK